MGNISLEGMRFYAYHGVYEEEQIIGNHFTVDVNIQTNLKKAAKTDDVFETINYETVYLVVQAVMNEKVKLIETLIENIIKKLKHQFSTIQSVHVRIEKANPIPGAQLSHSAVESHESYASKCPRCGSGFICYQDESCWCTELRIHPATRESIKQEFRGCLCKNCLSFYSG